VNPEELAADAAAEADARDGDADARLSVATRAAADLMALHAATYSPGRAGKMARVELVNLSERITQTCARYRELGSGPAWGWDAHVELDAQRRENRRLILSLDVARAALDFALAIAERGDMNDKWAAECRRMMRHARKRMDDGPSNS